MFIKHNYAWFTHDELVKNDLMDHLSRCSLEERVFQRPPRKVSFVLRHGTKFYCFPKTYAVEHMLVGIPPESESLPREVRVTDGARWPPHVSFEGKLDPARRQDEAVAKTLAQMERRMDGGAVLSLPCGYGKTVVALALASIIQRKTFILVHTKFLADQWASRIKQFLPKATVYHFSTGTKQGDDRDASISIGLVQSISRLDTYNFGSQYGLLVVDECHHVPATTLRQSLPRFNARYTLGLSATPHRADNLGKFIYWSLGPSSFIIKPSYPDVTVLKVAFSMPFAPYHDSFEDRIACSDARNAKICSIIKRMLLDPARRILCLSMRREHARVLHDMLCQDLPPGETRLALGGQDNDFERMDATTRVIVATFQLCSEGLDIPSLNTLLLTMPKSDLTQVIGRITRGGATNTKTEPLVIDLVDQCEVGKRKFYRRNAVYKALNMCIKNSQL